MPEGIEVCITSQYLNRKLRRKTFVELKVHGGKFKRKGLEGHNLIPKGAEIVKVDCKGKFMWIEFRTDQEGSGDSIYLMSSYGMAGWWAFREEKHAHIEIVVQDKNKKKYSLYYIDARNFGNMSITNQESDLQAKLDSLGPDLLKESWTDADLEARIQKMASRKSSGKKKIVAVLMDQNKTGLGSGIGNYLVNEILYRAKISPHTTIDQLASSKTKRVALGEAIRFTMRWSYETNSMGYMERMKHYLPRHREMLKSGELPTYHPQEKLPKGEAFNFKVYQQKKDPLGNEVVVEQIVNKRSAFWVKEVQK